VRKQAVGFHRRERRGKAGVVVFFRLHPANLITCLVAEYVTSVIQNISCTRRCDDW
jgi:hypothetical protein